MSVAALIWEIWPGDSKGRPTTDSSGEDISRYMVVRYAVVAHLDVEDAMSAVMAHAQRSKWEPRMSELVEIAEGRERGWVDALGRLVDAVDAHLRAQAPERNYVEHADGSWSVTPEAGFVAERWRHVAGENVAAVVDVMGGMHTVAQQIGDSTFRAQFRDLYSQQRDGSETPALESGRQSLGELVRHATPHMRGEMLGVLNAAMSRTSMPQIGDGR